MIKKVFLLLNISKRFVLKVKINKICAKNIVRVVPIKNYLFKYQFQNVKIKDFANEILFLSNNTQKILNSK